MPFLGSKYVVADVLDMNLSRSSPTVQQIENLGALGPTPPQVDWVPALPNFGFAELFSTRGSS